MSAAVRAHDEFHGRRFITIELREPDKAASRAWDEPGADRPPREADVVLLDRSDGSTHEIVARRRGRRHRLAAARRRPAAVRRHGADRGRGPDSRRPDFQAALRSRGIDGLQHRPGRRLAGRQLRAPRGAERPTRARASRSSDRTAATTSGRTPSTGVVALVDLNAARGAARRRPRRRARSRPSPASSARARASLRARPQAAARSPSRKGPSFSVDGYTVALAALAHATSASTPARVSCCTASATTTRRPPAADPAPGVARRDGRALRRPAARRTTSRTRSTPARTGSASRPSR